MKIYTRTGDGGQTSLMGAGRVSKDAPRVAAYGDVDETCSAIGVARAIAPTELADDLLRSVQRDLFAIGGSLATPEPAKVGAAQQAKLVVDATRLNDLERAIDEVDSELDPLKAFVLPSGSAKAASLHHARTVCRRAERAVVRLARHERVPPEVLAYLNRLSDLLFVLARLANRRAGVGEDTW